MSGDEVRRDEPAEAPYEAPAVVRVPLEEGTAFTAAIVSNSMGMECQ